MRHNSNASYWITVYCIVPYQVLVDTFTSVKFYVWIDDF